MVARHAKIGLAETIVVTQVGKSPRLRAKPDPLRENARQKQRMISDMDTDEKARALVCCAQGGEHFKKIIERILLAGKNATCAFSARKLRQNFRHVISNGAVLNVRFPENISHKHVKIKMRGDT